MPYSAEETAPLTAEGHSATAASAFNANQVEYWQAEYPNVGECVKYDPPGTANSYGSLSGDGKSVVLNANQALLVVKGGSAGDGSDGNNVVVNPLAGVSYQSPSNGGEIVPNVSHWIVCGYKTPPVVDTSVTPAAPTVDPICGADNDTVTIPTTTGVTYSDTGWSGGERTITATADEGYVLEGTASWTFTDEATTCPIELTEVTAMAASAADPPICGPNNDVVNVTPTDGVTYSDTGWVDGERTITATANKGFTLVGDTEWTFTDANTICPIELVDDKAIPTAPTVVPICGPNNDTVTIPEVDGVIYTDSGWVGGERTITAAADEGFTLVGDTEWTFTDVPVAACPDEPPAFSYTPTGELAYTGASTSTNGLTALAIFLMASGTALVALKARAAR